MGQRKLAVGCLILLLGLCVLESADHLTANPTKSGATAPKPETAIDRKDRDRGPASAEPRGADASSAPRNPANPGARARDLSDAIGGIEKADVLLGLFQAAERMEHDPSAEDRQERLMAELRRQPRESFRALTEALERLPRDRFPLERANVLDIMSVLATDREEMRALAIRELNEAVIPPQIGPEAARTDEELNQALSSSQDMWLPLVSHEIALKTARGFDDAMTLTLESLDRQKNKGVRSALGIQLARAYPAERQRIAEAFARHGDDLSFILTQQEN